jgi:hypothetical protein
MELGRAVRGDSFQMRRNSGVSRRWRIVSPPRDADFFDEVEATFGLPAFTLESKRVRRKCVEPQMFRLAAMPPPSRSRIQEPIDRLAALRL